MRAFKSRSEAQATTAPERYMHAISHNYDAKEQG